MDALPPQVTASVYYTADHAPVEPVFTDPVITSFDIQSKMPSREDLIQEMRDEFDKIYTEEKKAAAWEDTADIVKKYSDEMVDQWNREIDGLLTFAGLFSAILTGFNVQSYQLLQPAPTDRTDAILMQLSAQLSSLSFNSSFINTTQPAFDTVPTQPFRPPLYAIWLNCLWFASLVFSIASASIGIVVKQWLKEYNTGLYGTSRETARRRQYRLNNLIKWRVSAIVALLPVLLLIALVLFLAGLVVLAHSIHSAVTTVVAVLVGSLLAFLFVTTVLPAFSSSCCYRSPQAYAVFFVRKNVQRFALPPLFWAIAVFTWCLSLPLCILSELFGGLRNTFDSTCKLGNPWGDLAKDLRNATLIWKGEEQIEATQSRTRLDGEMMLMAYTASMDMRCLETAETCLVDTEDREFADWYIGAVHALLARRWGARWPRDVLGLYQKLVARVIRCVLVAPLHCVGPRTAQEWILEDVLPGRLLLVEGTGRPSSFDVLTYMVRTEAVTDVLLALALISMDVGNPAAAEKAWHALRGKYYEASHNSGGGKYLSRVVTAAVSHRLARFKALRYGGEMLNDDTTTVLEVFRQHIKTARLCLTKATPTVSEASTELEETTLFIGYTLLSFQDFLASPEWQNIARQRNTYPREEYLYLKILIEMKAIAECRHTRHLVTDMLVDGLVRGLEDVAQMVFEDIATEGPLYIIAAGRRLLEDMRWKMGLGAAGEELAATTDPTRRQDTY